MDGSMEDTDCKGFIFRLLFQVLIASKLHKAITNVYINVSINFRMVCLNH